MSPRVYCVSLALIVVLWFAVLSQIFAQSTLLVVDECSPPCATEFACVDGTCVAIESTSTVIISATTMSADANSTASSSTMLTAPPEMPGLLEHEMTLLGVSMALAVLLVILYYFFFDRPASRSAGYSSIDESAAAAVAAADSDDDV
jgi:hypothetical protein